MTREEMVRIREERGYSFARLSEYSGVPVPTLQKIFSGATRKPRKATLDAIERVLVGEEEVYQGKAYTYENQGLSDAVTVREEYAYTVKRDGEYTLDDYYALPEERRVELIDGVIYDMSSPKIVHQDIITLISMEIVAFIRSKKGKCKVFMSPVDVQLDCDNRTMVQPDILVICDRDKIKGFGIYGAPDFVVEILSKSTRKKDMTIKLNKYLEAGVREYWIVDPYRSKLIVYNFMEENYIPCVYNLTEEVPVAIFNGELKIDLTKIAESIEEFGE